MKILILGGTRFLGRHLVEAALARGHEVTLFNRGLTNPGLFPGVETLIGDRDGGLEALNGRRWDRAIDTSGRLPRIVNASAELLAGAVGHYSFLSSVAVYDDRSASDIGEHEAVTQLADESSEDVVGDYAPLKVRCEQAVMTAMPGRALIVRAGLLVGPWDDTARFTYWPWRIARGGEVLAPGRPDQPVQFIHARDLADWIVLMGEEKRTGTVNATGPEEPLTLAQLLTACREVTGGDARFTWVDEDFLLEKEVISFTEMPLWLREGRDGLLAMNIGKALAAGLALRPLAETIRETLDWHERLPAGSDDDQARLYRVEGKAGLGPEREARLLGEWHERAGPDRHPRAEDET